MIASNGLVVVFFIDCFSFFRLLNPFLFIFSLCKVPPLTNNFTWLTQGWQVFCLWIYRTARYLINFHCACGFYFRIPAAAAHVPIIARVKLDSPVKGFGVNATLDLLDQIAAKVLQNVFYCFNDKNSSRNNQSSADSKWTVQINVQLHMLSIYRRTMGKHIYSNSFVSSMLSLISPNKLK